MLKDRSAVMFIRSLLSRHRGKEVNREEVKIRELIGRSELMVPAERISQIYWEIASICFSFVYELLCMCGELGPESAKTINRTSLALHCNCLCLCSLKEMLIDCYVRCMSYSLYKGMQVARAAHGMLAGMMSLDGLKVMLLHLKKLFEESEPRYLLNKLYIDDYLRFLYLRGSEQTCLELEKELAGITIEEEELGLPNSEEEEEV